MNPNKEGKVEENEEENDETINLTNHLKSTVDKLMGAHKAKEKKLKNDINAFEKFRKDKETEIKNKENDILRDAKNKSEVIVSSAQQKAQIIVSDAESKARDIKFNIQKLEKDATAECKQKLSTANIKSLSIMEDAESKARATKLQARAMKAAIEREKEEWKEEQDGIAATQVLKNRIKLDVGGSRYTTSLTTLTTFPESMIGVMFSGRHELQLDEDGYYFIDRDGTHFGHILNFLRGPDEFIINISDEDAKKELKREATYYGLYDEIFSFIPCPETLLDENISGHSIMTIICYQSESGMWKFKNGPSCNYIFDENVTCCRHCNCGYVKVRHRTYGLRKFIASDGREIDNENQPKTSRANPCHLCNQ